MTGLIGWWPLHETQGNKANDLSGNRNHGELEGGISKGSIGVGGLPSYQMDGGGRIIVSHSGEITPQNSVSFSVWFRPFNWENADRIIFIRDSDGYYFQLLNGDSTGDGERNVYAAFGDEGGNRHDVNGISTPLNQWSHVVCTYDSKTAKIYVNGELEDISQIGGPLLETNTDMWVGDADGLDRNLHGSINDIRVYNRALSPSEVKELYRQGSQDLHKKSLSDGSDPGAISRWKLNDDGADGSTAVDMWGSNNGDINGSGGVFSDDSVRTSDKSLRFNGSDDRVEIGGIGLEDDAPHSMFGWIKTNNIGNDYQAIISSHDSDYGFSLSIDESSKRIRYGQRDSLGEFIDVKGGNIVPNTWYFVGAVFTGSRIILYINGAAVNSRKETEVRHGTRPIWIGADENYGQWFDGYLDNISVFDRALSSWEAFELYRWGSLGKDMRKELVNKKGGGQ